MKQTIYTGSVIDWASTLYIQFLQSTQLVPQGGYIKQGNPYTPILPSIPQLTHLMALYCTPGTLVYPHLVPTLYPHVALYCTSCMYALYPSFNNLNHAWSLCTLIYVLNDYSFFMSIINYIIVIYYICCIITHPSWV